MNSHVKEACGSKTADLPVWSVSTQLPFSPLSEALFHLYWEAQRTWHSSVQSLSCVRLFATPWITARQASLSITNSQSSLRLTRTWHKTYQIWTVVPHPSEKQNLGQDPTEFTHFSFCSSLIDSGHRYKIKQQQDVKLNSKVGSVIGWAHGWSPDTFLTPALSFLFQVEKLKGGQEGGLEGRKEGKEDRLIFLAQSGSEVFSHDYLLSEYLNVKSAAGPCESCPLLPVWLFPWTVCWKVGCPVSPTGFLLSSCLGLSFFQQNSLFHQLFCCHLLPVPVQPSNSELNLAHRPTSQPLNTVCWQTGWLVCN